MIGCPIWKCDARGRGGDSRTGLSDAPTGARCVAQSEAATPLPKLYFPLPEAMLPRTEAAMPIAKIVMIIAHIDIEDHDTPTWGYGGTIPEGLMHLPEVVMSLKDTRNADADHCDAQGRTQDFSREGPCSKRASILQLLRYFIRHSQARNSHL